MTFVSKNKSFHVSAQAKEVYDVSGAGDTVIACLTAAIIKGKSIRESVEFTNKAAGIVVGHVGTSAITLNELELQ
jgi:bifunctional ADP-heptose synthase (sugar kinase/adenylyltransferase)